MSAPTLEETFAGCLGGWRVEDKGGEAGRPRERRFAVMARPIFRNDPNLEFELCAVQYRPHAEAIAALPELAAAVIEAKSDFENLSRDGYLPTMSPLDLYVAPLDLAIAKAEGKTK